jgi:hypothetical protein
MRRQREAAQVVSDIVGEAMEAITGLEQAASRGEEDGEARRPTVVAGELH